MKNFYVNILVISRFTFFVICLFASFAVFIIGFIPTRVTKLKPESTHSVFFKCVNITQSPDICRKFNDASYPKRYDNVILIVIDALRADFIPSISNNPEFNISLPFTEKLIKQKFAHPFISKVHSPTVTLPRIKSLVTGGISNFMDVLMNLNAAELNEDSILHQARAADLKSVFYGDNTWLKLFPDLFTRSEGTHSFFVSDFQEVDNNVTENMELEFLNFDWNILILHYLGVDHIGHAYGPHSQYLAPKLKEMDDIIKFIYETLLLKGKFHSLIVICGDHGMTSSGSHGGVSQAELLTPLIFINLKQNSRDYDSIKTIDQVDLASTLSVLLDLPIPSNSFGNVLSDVLDYSSFDHGQSLYAMFNNLIQLFEIHKSVFPEKSEIYKEYVKNVITNHSEAIIFSQGKLQKSIPKYSSLLESYICLLKEMKQDLITNTMGYNDFYIVSGLIMIWLFFTCTVISYLIIQKDNNMIGMLFSTIKSPTLSISILPFLLIFYLSNSYALCIIYIGMVIMHLVIWIIRFLIKYLHLTFMEKSCTFLLFLHAVSLFSSSYIEEEHQVWYFLISTIFTLYLIRCLCSVISDFLKLDAEKQGNMYCVGNFLYNNNNFNNVCLLLNLLISHRLLRCWNQTGDKWQHLPDIADWLDKEENAVFALVLGIMSHILIVIYIGKVQSILTYSCMCLSMVFIYLHQYHNAMLSKLLMTFHVDLIIVPWTVYCLIFVIIISMLFQTSKEMNSSKLTIKIIIVWLLLTQLIGRNHNIPLIAATLLQENFLHKILWINRFESVFRICCYLLMSMGSFFYLGNSNSLSTIDVYSGYVGLLSYQPIIVGILITCNTYSTVVLWILLMIYRMQIFNPCKSAQISSAQEIFHSFVILLMYKIFVLAVYCIVMFIMKHHLFFLSVFAPKLFYEVCHVILIMIFTFIFTIATICSENNELLRKTL